MDRFVDLSNGGSRSGSVMTIGRVTGVHIDEFVTDGDRIDIVRAAPIARPGYFDYRRVNIAFYIAQPKLPLTGRTE